MHSFHGRIVLARPIARIPVHIDNYMSVLIRTAQVACSL